MSVILPPFVRFLFVVYGLLLTVVLFPVLWVLQRLGVSDDTFCRLLRLDPDEFVRLRAEYGISD